MILCTLDIIHELRAKSQELIFLFAVRHEQYLDLDPDMIVKQTGKPIAVVDCFGILDDSKIMRYLELGCEVKGLGRGHIRRLKESIKKQ